MNNFRAALAKTGLDYAGEIIADGKLHRFKADGDHQRNSWYVLHAGPPSAGAFGCWKRGFKETWCDRSSNLSQAEWNEVRRCWKEAEREREKAETERHAQARKTAVWILDRAKPVKTHAYLAAKSVKVFGDVRQYRGALVLPLRDADGELHSLQFIGADGVKRFLSGGCIARCFFMLADKTDGALVICEGYATGASIHAATCSAVVCALNCHNLKAVAEAAAREISGPQHHHLRGQRPVDRRQPRQTKAAEAAKTIHARLAVPQFKDTTTKPTDFNDLHQLEGLDTVKTQIENATTPKETDLEAFDRLAKLPPADYDRCREDEAKRLNIRVTTLDTEIQKRRHEIQR